MSKILLAIVLIQSAAMVHGGSHSSDADCGAAVMPLMSDPPKTNDGEVCLPMGGRRLFADPMEMAQDMSRRLAAHEGGDMAAMMKNICKPECLEVVEGIKDKCEGTGMDDMLKDLYGIPAMCKDPCANKMLMMMVNQCNAGDDMSKVCDLTGVCRDSLCEMKNACDCTVLPPLPGMSLSDWKAGCQMAFSKEPDCPCPAPDETAGAFRMIVSSSLVALLLSTFA
eukprot:gnl/TRDRNA2_/TRDRNA2_170117_c0_seq1.p1 gnl/TRDRNA2_/TRDRNA2_170117_c0~~gnl/TRDRNA2_/TRDRNA2_170117_c0_seq1.p1  ORF type:complete len:252 (-),score=37.56 gnl/TRDRNA2_/TRDRNA2_170117_c0_seq1:295-966(-)